MLLLQGWPFPLWAFEQIARFFLEKTNDSLFYQGKLLPVANFVKSEVENNSLSLFLKRAREQVAPCCSF